MSASGEPRKDTVPFGASKSTVAPASAACSSPCLRETVPRRAETVRPHERCGAPATAGSPKSSSTMLRPWTSVGASSGMLLKGKLSKIRGASRTAVTLRSNWTSVDSSESTAAQATLTSASPCQWGCFPLPRSNGAMGMQ